MQNITGAFVGLAMIGLFLTILYFSPVIPRPRGTIFSNFEFASEGNCSEAANTANAELTEGNTIAFSGCVLLPTPCHTLDTDYNIRTTEQGQDIVTINLVTLSPPADTVCIQIVQPTAFRGSFDLKSLNFEVDIVYEGEVLERFAAIA